MSDGEPDSETVDEPEPGTADPGASGGKYCISCGEQIAADAEFCPECGVSQVKLPTSGGAHRTADEKHCTSCGAVVNRDAELCPECGVRQTVGTGVDSDKDRVTAGVLALLLGGLGAHKFYLGETGLGILYLCFSWTFIPALVGLVEGILYLTKTDEEFQRRYVDG